jgi:hypothetical protein
MGMSPCSAGELLQRAGNISGDIVGRDKIVHGIDETKLIAALVEHGLIRRGNDYLMSVAEELDKLAKMWIKIAMLASHKKVNSLKNIGESLMYQSINFQALRRFVFDIRNTPGGQVKELNDLATIIDDAIATKGILYNLITRYVTPNHPRGEAKDNINDYYNKNDLATALDSAGGNKIEAIAILRRNMDRKAQSDKETMGQLRIDRRIIATQIAAGAEKIALIAGEFRASVCLLRSRNFI